MDVELGLVSPGHQTAGVGDDDVGYAGGVAGRAVLHGHELRGVPAVTPSKILVDLRRVQGPVQPARTLAFLASGSARSAATVSWTGLLSMLCSTRMRPRQCSTQFLSWVQENFEFVPGLG